MFSFIPASGNRLVAVTVQSSHPPAWPLPTASLWEPSTLGEGPFSPGVTPGGADVHGEQDSLRLSCFQASVPAAEPTHPQKSQPLLKAGEPGGWGRVGIVNFLDLDFPCAPA